MGKKRKSILYTFIISVVLLVIIMGSWMFKRPVVPPCHPDEVYLTGWVYSHSTRMSRVQCAEIVKEAMGTRRPELMLAIMELESIKFTPGALSSDGAIGWCQVMFDDTNGKDVHGKELIGAGIIKEKRDLWDTGTNIKAGAFVLEKKLRASGGDVARALEGYVGKKYGAYVVRVLSSYANIKENQIKSAGTHLTIVAGH